MKKFELTTDSKIFCGKKLFRIKALVSFDVVRKGDVGGYVESENNLSDEGNAWVYKNALVYGNARVYDNAWVYENACVRGDARVYGNAWVCENACVSGDARVYVDADYATIKGFGSGNRNTTFFKINDGGVGVECGCYFGNLADFRSKVKETHGESKIAREYLLIADLMGLHFKDAERENG